MRKCHHVSEEVWELIAIEASPGDSARWAALCLVSKAFRKHMRHPKARKAMIRNMCLAFGARYAHGTEAIERMHSTIRGTFCEAQLCATGMQDPDERRQLNAWGSQCTDAVDEINDWFERARALKRHTEVAAARLGVALEIVHASSWENQPARIQVICDDHRVFQRVVDDATGALKHLIELSDSLMYIRTVGAFVRVSDNLETGAVRACVVNCTPKNLKMPWATDERCNSCWELSCKKYCLPDDQSNRENGTDGAMPAIALCTRTPQCYGRSNSVGMGYALGMAGVYKVTQRIVKRANELVVLGKLKQRREAEATRRQAQVAHATGAYDGAAGVSIHYNE